MPYAPGTEYRGDQYLAQAGQRMNMMSKFFLDWLGKFYQNSQDKKFYGAMLQKLAAGGKVPGLSGGDVADPNADAETMSGANPDINGADGGGAAGGIDAGGIDAGGMDALGAGVAGFAAEGGPIDAGRRYVVGEQGPELFLPNRGGGTATGGAPNANSLVSQMFMNFARPMNPGGAGGAGGMGQMPPSGATGNMLDYLLRMPGAANTRGGQFAAGAGWPMPGGTRPNPQALLGLPYRAQGGPVDAGQPTVVGEDGPEIIVPGQNGTVIPNAATLGRRDPRMSPPMDDDGNPDFSDLAKSSKAHRQLLEIDYGLDPHKLATMSLPELKGTLAAIQMQQSGAMNSAKMRDMEAQAQEREQIGNWRQQMMRRDQAGEIDADQFTKDWAASGAPVGGGGTGPEGEPLPGGQAPDIRQRLIDTVMKHPLAFRSGKLNSVVDTLLKMGDKGETAPVQVDTLDLPFGYKGVAVRGSKDLKVLTDMTKQPEEVSPGIWRDSKGQLKQFRDVQQQTQLEILKEEMKSLNHGIANPGFLGAEHVKKLETRKGEVQKQLDTIFNGGASAPEENPNAGTKAVTPDLAKQFIQKAGGDKTKARALAKAAGYTF